MRGNAVSCQCPRCRYRAKRNLITVLRNAGMPLLIDDNRAYFIGTDERGRCFELILVTDDRDADLWIAIHAMPTNYRKNWWGWFDE